MTEIVQFQNQDLEAIRRLLSEYLAWANEQAQTQHNRSADIDAMLKSSIAEIELFSPPSGRLLLAKTDGVSVGMGWIKQVREDACIIKRMYVQPDQRGKKVGKTLLRALIQAAREIGYARILLDSGFFMKNAHRLYYSAGFKDIAPYSEPHCQDHKSTKLRWKNRSSD